MNSPEPSSGTGLVLVAPAGLSALGPAARLAGLLGLRLLPSGPGPDDDPAAVLAAMADHAPGWLLPLPIDPGQELNRGGCWAEALAAWRQPALLLLPQQAPAGAPRAYDALLRSAGVPLLGLVQLGGTWAPALRHRDGLPWLGWVPATEPEPAGTLGASADDAAVQLIAACRRRWRQISAARPPAPLSHPPGAADRPA